MFPLEASVEGKAACPKPFIYLFLVKRPPASIQGVIIDTQQESGQCELEIRAVLYDTSGKFNRKEKGKEKSNHQV